MDTALSMTDKFVNVLLSKNDGGYNYGKLTVLGVAIGAVIGAMFLIAIYIALF